MTTAGVAWYAKVYKKFTISVPPNFDAGVDGAGFTKDVGVSLAPDFSFDGAGRSVKAFTISVPVHTDFVPPSHAGAISVTLPPSLTVSGKGRMPAAFSVSTPPAVHVTGKEHYTKTLGLSLPPTFGFTKTANQGVSPPVYSLTGTSGAADGSSTVTGSVNPTSTSYVVVAVNVAFPLGARTISSVTCGGTAMTSLGAVDHNNTSTVGRTYLYGLSGVSTGSKSLVATFSGSVYGVLQSVAFTGATSAGTAQTGFGSGTSLSQSATCTSGQALVQAFGNRYGGFTSPSGGTNRFNGVSAQAYGSMSLSTATASVGFTATASSNEPWAAIAVPLNP